MFGVYISRSPVLVCQLRDYRLPSYFECITSILSLRRFGHEANQTVPIVPYLQNGGGQVPLRGFLPSLSSSPSRSSAVLPTYPPVAVYSSDTPEETPNVAPDASHDNFPPTINIPIEHHLHEQSSGQAQTSSLVAVGGSSDESDIQMRGKKPAIAATGTFLGLFTFSQIYQNILAPKITPGSERAEERSWVASSHSWLDRKTCHWFGFCGLAHLNKAGWTSKGKKQRLSSVEGKDSIDLSKFWEDVQSLPENWSEEEFNEREIPKYVIDHAPYIHLYSGEEYWPGDIAEHLIHTTPHLNYTPLQAVDDHPNLTNLNELNDWGRFVYLQSDDNVEDHPEWLGGESNIPEIPGDDEDSDIDWEEEEGLPNGHFTEDEEGENASWWDVGIGDTKDKGGIRPPPGASTSPIPIPTDTPQGEEVWQSELIRRRLMGKKVVGGRSDAPAALIVVPKENGVVDAFWFFFYSFNQGNAVFNVRFGNHVGDWEHTVVRFQDGIPKAVFFSEHSFGEAYTWEAIEKIGKRPLGFSATGTHAMYATAGVHPYVLPGGILHDVTDRGPLWDPTLNLYSFTYDFQQDRLLSSNLTPQAPVGWFYFAGHWGDKFYQLSDPRQYRFLGQYHYVNGPLGPRFKNLGRKQICQGNDECLLKRWIGDKRARRVKRYPTVGEGEEMSEEDVRRVFGPERDRVL